MAAPGDRRSALRSRSEDFTGIDFVQVVDKCDQTRLRVYFLTDPRDLRPPFEEVEDEDVLAEPLTLEHFRIYSPRGVGARCRGDFVPAERRAALGRRCVSRPALRRDLPRRTGRLHRVPAADRRRARRPVLQRRHLLVQSGMREPARLRRAAARVRARRTRRFPRRLSRRATSSASAMRCSTSRRSDIRTGSARSKPTSA